MLRSKNPGKRSQKSHRKSALLSLDVYQNQLACFNPQRWRMKITVKQRIFESVNSQSGSRSRSVYREGILPFDRRD